MLEQRDSTLSIHALTFGDDDLIELPIGKLSIGELQTLSGLSASVSTLNEDDLLPLQVATQFDFPIAVVNTLLQQCSDAIVLLRLSAT